MTVSDEEMVATTVRLPRSQIDALDSASEEGTIPNRSEGIRAAVGRYLDSDDVEIPDEAATLAAFQRTKRQSKVWFYREGFQQMVGRVLGAVAKTTPPWHPDAVERTAPRIFERQIQTLFDSEERREEARETLQAEIRKYREAYDESDVDEVNQYLAALAREDDGDEDGEWSHSWEPDVDELADHAVGLLAEGAQDSVEGLQAALANRRDVTDDLAAEATQRAVERYDGRVEDVGPTEAARRIAADLDDPTVDAVVARLADERDMLRYEAKKHAREALAAMQDVQGVPADD